MKKYSSYILLIAVFTIILYIAFTLHSKKISQYKIKIREVEQESIRENNLLVKEIIDTRIEYKDALDLVDSLENDNRQIQAKISSSNKAAAKYKDLYQKEKKLSREPGYKITDSTFRYSDSLIAQQERTIAQLESIIRNDQITINELKVSTEKQDGLLMQCRNEHEDLVSTVYEQDEELNKKDEKIGRRTTQRNLVLATVVVVIVTNVIVNSLK